MQSGARCLPAVVLVPVQAGAWLLLLSVNHIPVMDPVLILLHVTLGSLVLILIAALVALHYRERTAAQFVFSTALVVIMILVLAVPGNPLNLVAQLAVGTAGLVQWIVLAGAGAASVLLGIILQWFAGKAGRQLHTGKN